MNKKKNYLDSAWFDIKIESVFRKDFNGKTFYSLNLNETYVLSIDKIYENKQNDDVVSFRLITHPVFFTGIKKGETRKYIIYNRIKKTKETIDASEIKSFILGLENSNIIERKSTFTKEERKNYLFK